MAWIKPSKKDMAVTFSYWSCRPFLGSSQICMSCRGCILDAAGFPPAIPHVETQMFHLLFHKLTFFEFDSEMVFLTNNEKFTEEKDMVLLGISGQTYVVDVGFSDLCPFHSYNYRL